MITAQSFRFDNASDEALADDLNDRDSLESAVQNHVEPLLSSTAPVIDGVEKLDAWIEHREIVVQELCPVGALETLYTERAALYLWRLNRVIGNENEAPLGGIEAGSEKKRADSPESRLNRTSPDRSKLQTLIKYEAHLNRCLTSTMAELRRLQRERRQGFRFVNPGGRGADRAGVCQHQQIKVGSPGGSPSQNGTPTQKSSQMQSSSPAKNQNVREAGSPGGSPSQTSSPSQIGTPTQKSSPMKTNSSMNSESRNQRNSTSRKHNASKRAAPRPKTPPLLESITNRRRLEEYTRGEIFERNLASATLDFAMIPRP